MLSPERTVALLKNLAPSILKVKVVPIGVTYFPAHVAVGVGAGAVSLARSVVISVVSVATFAFAVT